MPKNYEGLLHPALKGRMGVSVSDPAYKVIGAMISTRVVGAGQKAQDARDRIAHDTFRRLCSI